MAIDLQGVKKELQDFPFSGLFTFSTFTPGVSFHLNKKHEPVCKFNLKD